jgi:hypothetical protein
MRIKSSTNIPFWIQSSKVIWTNSFVSEEELAELKAAKLLNVNAKKEKT